MQELEALQELQTLEHLHRSNRYRSKSTAKQCRNWKQLNNNVILKKKKMERKKTNLKTFYISENQFSKEEIKTFKKTFGYDLKKNEYSAFKEIDFSEINEKEFLLKKGYLKILARFFY